MTYQAIPIVDPSKSGQEQEVKVLDNDSKVLLEQTLISQKLIILHLEKITDEVFNEEDINPLTRSI